MQKTVRGVLIFLLVVAGGLCPAPPTFAGVEKSAAVTSTDVPFQAGEVVPVFEHNIFKLEALIIEIGEIDVKSGKQRVELEARIHNFGEKDHRCIVTFSLRDKDGKIVASKTDKNDIDDNDRDNFEANFKLLGAEVARVDTLHVEVSSLSD